MLHPTFTILTAACALAPAQLQLAGTAGTTAATEEKCILGAWEAPFQHDVTGFVHPPPPDLSGLYNATHLALIPVGPHRGKVFTMDQGFPEEYPMRQQRMALLDLDVPGAPQFTNFELTMPVTDEHVGFELFCAGHTWLPDGRLFVAGGTLSTLEGAAEHEEGLGIALAYIWDTTTGTNPLTGLVGTWTRLPDMMAGRYYPSTTLTGADKVVVSGGTGGPDAHALNSYEVWNLAAGAWQPGGPFDGPGVQLHGYPRLSLLSSGKLLLSGMESCSYLLDHEQSPGVWQAADCSEGPLFNLYNTSLLLPGAEDVVLKLGGLMVMPDNRVVMNATWRANAGAPGWSWALDAQQPHIARSFGNAVILPNGDVFLVGGYSGTGVVDDLGVLLSADVGLPLTPEVRSAATGKWQLGAPGVSPREYHSTALLLPDGRVLVAGGEIRLVDYEIYRPWYLTCGKPRPVITSVPSTMKVQSAGVVKYDVKHAPLAPGVTIQQVVLVAPGSVTHHSDFSQRSVRLQILNQTQNGVRVLGPKSSHHAPRGWYMLFLVTGDGVPSEAGWVRVE
jgi:galactose oxidase